MTDLKQWTRHSDILHHERTILALSEVAELLRRVRRASAVEDYVLLQQDLARKGWEAHRFHVEMTQAIAAHRLSIPEAKAAGRSSEVAAASRSITELRLALDANRARWAAPRGVQDAILWQITGYDRHLITTLGHGEPVVGLSETFASEVAAAEEHWNAGRLALLCDLSSCINTGDLLVFDSDSIVVTEVKRSDREIDATWQWRRMKVRVEFLNEGRSDDLAERPVLAPVRRPVLRTHLSTFADLVRRAGRSGYSVSRVGGDRIVAFVDLRSLPAEVPTADLLGRMLRQKEKVVRKGGIAWRDWQALPYTSMERLNRDHSHPVASTAPFSIFPLPVENCAALMLGYLTFRTDVNMTVVLATLAARGWFPAAPPRGAPDGFLCLGNGRLVQVVPSTLADQLLLEMLTTSALVESVEAGATSVQQAPENGIHTAWAWDDEARIWAGKPD